MAGGVKHASEIDSHNRGKTADVTNSHMTRDRIDVEVSAGRVRWRGGGTDGGMQMRHLSLSWERRGRGAVKSKKKTILDDVSVKFPAGEVSAILGPSGAGKVSFGAAILYYWFGSDEPAVNASTAPCWS